MKNKSKLAVSVLVASLAGLNGMLNAQQNNQENKPIEVAIPEIAGNRAEAVKALIKNRINVAKLELKKAIAEFPEHEIKVTASFTRALDIHDVVNKAREEGLIIEGFRHGNSDHSGGYSMSPGESLDDAIRQYEHDFILFCK